MSPSFSPDVTEYTVIVSYSIPDFKFSWTKSDANATVQYIPTEGNTLIVGDNTFKFIVTAEDKTTTKTYTAVVKRLQMGEEVPQFVDDVPEEDEEILPDESNGLDIPEDDVVEDNESPEQESTPDRDNILQGGFGTEVSLKLSTLLWIVAGVVALFILAFMGGYVTHKNASKPAQYTIEDILTAQQYLELQNMRGDIAASQREPQQPEEYPEQPEEEYQSGETYSDYQQPPVYPDYSMMQMQMPMYGEYPQVDEYGNPVTYPQVDEYGNPIAYQQMDEYGNPIENGGVGYNNY